MEHPPPFQKKNNIKNKMNLLNINDPKCGQFNIRIVIYVSKIVCQRKKGLFDPNND